MQDPDQIVFVAALTTAALALPAAGTLSLIRSRQGNPVLRAILTVAILLVIIGAPMMVDWLVLRLNSTSGPARVFIDPGPITMWSPSLLALVTAFIMGARHGRAVRA